MKTVYFDVDTQLDFVVAGGSLYVPCVSRVIGNVARLNREAAAGMKRLPRVCLSL